MNLRRTIKETLGAPFYRTRPVAVAQLLWAKWRLRQSRVSDPEEFLTEHGIDLESAFSGFPRWETLLGDVVERVTRASEDHGGVSWEDGKILFACTRWLKPRFIVETGVAAGVSTSFILAALVENNGGVLYSIELPPERRASQSTDPDGASFDWAERGVAWAEPRELKDAIGNRHVLLLEDVRSALPGLIGKLPEIDIFFHDSLHTPDHMSWEYGVAWQQLRNGGLLISDDVNWAWLSFCKAVEPGSRKHLRNVQRLALMRKT